MTMALPKGYELTLMPSFFTDGKEMKSSFPLNYLVCDDDQKGIFTYRFCCGDNFHLEGFITVYDLPAGVFSVSVNGSNRFFRGVNYSFVISYIYNLLLDWQRLCAFHLDRP